MMIDATITLAAQWPSAHPPILSKAVAELTLVEPASPLNIHTGVRSVYLSGINRATLTRPSIGSPALAAPRPLPAPTSSFSTATSWCPLPRHRRRRPVLPVAPIPDASRPMPASSRSASFGMRRSATPRAHGYNKATAGVAASKKTVYVTGAKFYSDYINYEYSKT